MSGRRVLLCLAALLSLGFGARGRLSAQETVDSTAIPVVRTDTLPRSLSPRAAMIRSFMLWGWGQASVGSWFRGGVWFSMEASTSYILFRTITRLNTAKDFRDRAVAFATDSLNRLIEDDTMAARVLSDPAAFDAAVDEGPGVATARKLVSARKQQRQDWVTWAVFFTLMSGIDAYVNAHLHDFPTTIGSGFQRDGSVWFSLSLPVPPWLGGHDPGPATVASPAYPRHRW